MLKDHDVPVPRHAVVNRDKQGKLQGHHVVIHEHDDTMEIDGKNYSFSSFSLTKSF